MEEPFTLLHFAELCSESEPNTLMTGITGCLLSNRPLCHVLPAQWAEVLSADAFAAFEEAGLDDDKTVASVGQKFRDTVLAMGGARAPLDVFKACLQRLSMQAGRIYLSYDPYSWLSHKPVLVLTVKCQCLLL